MYDISNEVTKCVVGFLYCFVLFPSLCACNVFDDFKKKDTDKTCQYFTGLSISFYRRIPAVARKFGDVQNEARRVTVLLLSSELEIALREVLDHTLTSATILRKKTLNRQNRYALLTLNYLFM